MEITKSYQQMQLKILKKATLIGFTSIQIIPMKPL